MNFRTGLCASAALRLRWMTRSASFCASPAFREDAASLSSAAAARVAAAARLSSAGVAAATCEDSTRRPSAAICSVNVLSSCLLGRFPHHLERLGLHDADPVEHVVALPS